MFDKLAQAFSMRTTLLSPSPCHVTHESCALGGKRSRCLSGQTAASEHLSDDLCSQDMLTEVYGVPVQCVWPGFT